MSERDFQRIEMQIDRLGLSTEKNIEKNYKQAADSVKREIAKLMEKHVEVTPETMNKYNRVQALEQRLYDTTRQAYGANRKEINASLRKTFLETSKSTVSAIDKEGNFRLRPITKSKKITEVINNEVQGLDWRDRMNKHQGDVMYELKKQVGKSIANGDTYATTARRIQRTFDVDENKAKTIARNEIARVKSVSQQETLDEVSKSGVDMVKVWRSVNDERSRTQHADMDGTEVAYEDEFEFPDGVTAKAPRLSGAAHHDINCRCFITIEFKKKEPESVRGVDLDNIKVGSNSSKLFDERVRRVAEAEYSELVGKDKKELYQYARKITKDPSERALQRQARRMMIDDEAEKVLQLNSDLVYEQLTTEQKDAMDQYTRMSYNDINSYLRGTGKGRSNTSKLIRNIDEVMDKHKLAEDITVYRGVTKDVVGKLDLGDTYSDKAYMSTSYKEGIADGFTSHGQDHKKHIMKIKVDKNKTKGVYAGVNSYHMGEGEFLIARESEFVLENITRKGKTIIYEMRSK